MAWSPSKSCPATWVTPRMARPSVRRDLEGVWKRGEVIDALPRIAQVLIEAKFNKPVKIATLIPIERGASRPSHRREASNSADRPLLGLDVRRPDGSRIYRVQPWKGGYERDLNRLEPLPEEPGPRAKSAAWGFATTPRMIAYRIELVDDRGFTNSVVDPPKRSHVGGPPAHRRRSNRNRRGNPDPNDRQRQGQPERLRMGRQMPTAPTAADHVR